MKSTLPEGLELGCVAKDTISGFEGVVIAITEWLNGCVRISIQPKHLEAGKPVESHTFDVEQVTVVEPLSKPLARSQKGGPSISPLRTKDPR